MTSNPTGEFTMKTNGGKTGHPPGLLQDDSRKLHKWFASRLDARHVIRKQFGDPRKNKPTA